MSPLSRRSSSSTDEKDPDGPSDAPPPGLPPPAYPAYPHDKPPSSSQETDHLTFQPQPAAPQAGFGTRSPSQRSVYAALLLCSWDKIRIVGFPSSIIAPVDAAIKRSWSRGVQQQKAYDQVSWEWKLCGKPCGCISFFLKLVTSSDIEIPGQTDRVALVSLADFSSILADTPRVRARFRSSPFSSAHRLRPPRPP